MESGNEVQAMGLYEPSLGCRHLGIADDARDVSFMFIDGTLVRIDTRSAHVATPSGVHIADTRAKVMRVCQGRIVETPHAYSDGTYLTLYSSDGKFGIRFEIEDGKVVGMHSGTAEAIQLVEGCA